MEQAISRNGQDQEAGVCTCLAICRPFKRASLRMEAEAAVPPAQIVMKCQNSAVAMSRQQVL